MARYTKTGTPSTIGEVNAQFDLIATAIGDTLSRVGDSPNQLETTLDANSQRIINLPAPAAPSDPARLVDVTNSVDVSRNNDLTSTYTFKSKVLMQASTIVFPDGKKVFWQGYYVESDGGTNWGIVTSGSHTDNGGSVFTLADGKYVAANLKGKKINVRKFGARTTGQDSILNFNAAIDYTKALANPMNRTPLYVPQGSYVLSAVLKPHWGGMVGDGVEATELDFSTCTDDSCVEWGNDVSFNYKGKLTDFKVKGNLAVSLQAALKLLKLGTSSTVARITTNPAQIGLYLKNIFYTSFDDLNLFGQFNNGQAGQILQGFGIYCERPINNVVFKNCSVQYFNTPFSCYDNVSETETSNNIVFLNSSFERNSGVVFFLRRTSISVVGGYVEHTRYNRDPANTDLAHLVIGSLGSLVVFSNACRLSMTGDEIAGDYVFDGDCNVIVDNSKLDGGSTIRALKPSSLTQLKYIGFKNTDLASISDFSDASYQAANQNSGASEFKSAYSLQTGGNFKTLPLFQTSGGAETPEVVKVTVFDPFFHTAIMFDVTVTRRQQGNAVRTAKYTVTVGRRPDTGALDISTQEFGIDRSDFFAGLLFPADPDDMFNVAYTDLGSTLEYTLSLKVFSSGSGSATEATQVIIGRAEYLTLDSGASTALEQRTNMSILIDNKT
jgi:hypothetical protein